MNITSTLVGVAIMGSTMPMMTQMAITPVVASKRAENFAAAESTAVAFSAAHDGANTVGAAPAGCTLSPLGSDAYSITCEEGKNKFAARVTRSFRLDTENGNNPVTGRSFPYANPGGLGAHQCPTADPYGVEGWWIDTYKSALGNCIPQAGWTKRAYLNSNPDNWLWDMNNIRGYGAHPDY